MAIDPRTPIIPGRSMSCFHRPGRHWLHQARRADIHMDDSFKELIKFPVQPLPEKAMGVLCNCLLGAVT